MPFSQNGKNINMDQPVTEKYLPSGRAGTRKPRILVAPLDWGLGHATRCVPVIRELLAQGCEVWLAGEGAQEQLLKAEFPELPFLALAGYRIRYAKTASGLAWKMIRQGPKLRRAIRQEHDWLKKKLEEHGFDAVISDNRYGLYHKSIPCIFITHQLRIKSSLGIWTEKLLQKRNYKYINRFSECWVPDMPGENNLAGELSHPQKKPVIPLIYIGPLSRFENSRDLSHSPLGVGGLLVLLSGPEPQRTLLENKIVDEISHHNGTATIVRGLPGSFSLIPSTNMLHFYNHLPAEELDKEIQQAEFVIGRSGYSTVMDLVKLKKKNILIPTPGQTEQEYLARYLLQKQIAFSVPQKDFSLADALQQARQFSYCDPAIDSGLLFQQTISRFLSTLSFR
jgi:UDP-N-acetylglucosamine transferase subunit ALG13